MELFLILAFTPLASFLFPTIFAGCLPDPLPSPISRHVSFDTLQVLFSRPTTDEYHSPFRFAYRSATPVPPGDSVSPPEVTRCSSVRAARNHLVRWVNENAFVPEVQTRPAPPLADRFILGIVPIDCSRHFPHALDFTLRWTPALRSTASSGSRSVLAVSSFPFRARLDVSIPSAFSGQRGYEPRFWIWRPSLSARGTLTLQNNALLSTHFRIADNKPGMSRANGTHQKSTLDRLPSDKGLGAASRGKC